MSQSTYTPQSYSVAVKSPPRLLSMMFNLWKTPLPFSSNALTYETFQFNENVKKNTCNNYGVWANDYDDSTFHLCIEVRKMLPGKLGKYYKAMLFKDVLQITRNASWMQAQKIPLKGISKEALARYYHLSSGSLSVVSWLCTQSQIPVTSYFCEPILRSAVTNGHLNTVKWVCAQANYMLTTKHMLECLRIYHKNPDARVCAGQLAILEWMWSKRIRPVVAFRAVPQKLSVCFPHDSDVPMYTHSTALRMLYIHGASVKTFQWLWEKGCEFSNLDVVFCLTRQRLQLGRSAPDANNRATVQLRVHAKTRPFASWIFNNGLRHVSTCLVELCCIKHNLGALLWLLDFHPFNLATDLQSSLDVCVQCNFFEGFGSLMLRGACMGIGTISRVASHDSSLFTSYTGRLVYILINSTLIDSNFALTAEGAEYVTEQLQQHTDIVIE